jgi:FkbM family methyltransferase
MLLHKLFVSDNEVFSPHGVSIIIPKDGDLAIRYLLARGRPYEAPEADMVRKYLSIGMNVIELGGCYGIISALIQKQIGPDAKHIIVEADPSLAKICAANANLDNTDNGAELVIAAVDYSGEKKITFAKGQNAHDGHIAGNGEPGFSVSTTTLAKQVKKLPENEYILVCDIEGAELELSINEKAALSQVYLLILETHADIYPRKKLDYEEMQKNIENAGLTEIEKSGAVVCFASKTAMRDLNLI